MSETKPPVAVITAKANSSRLPGKNMLPLGGMPLSLWSVREAARLGLESVVCTDIEELKASSARVGMRVVHQEPMDSHADVIRHALKKCSWEDRPCILLQPTSPFRRGDIVSRCWDAFVNAEGSSTVLTTSVSHEAVVREGTLVNSGSSLELWDGCVAVYPAGKVCDYSSLVAVRNLHCNTIQIDTEEDYIQACSMHEMLKEPKEPLPRSVVNLLRPVFASAGVTGEVTLVGRADQRPIPQDRPVAYINHCVGYDGGRCDMLFVIANAHMRKVGINAELRECASKAKVVVVRSNGEIGWLLENLPEIAGKFYPLREAIDAEDDHLTSGCLAAWLLRAVGARVDFRGMYRPAEATKVLLPYHAPALSREIALLRASGVF